MHPLTNRQSHRLSGYDNSQNGLYFITIVSQNREERFGKIVGGQMILNDVGKMIVSEWCSLPMHFSHVELDAFVMMPNHIHGILILDDGNEMGDNGMDGNTTGEYKIRPYSVDIKRKCRGEPRTTGISSTTEIYFLFQGMFTRPIITQIIPMVPSQNQLVE